MTKQEDTRRKSRRDLLLILLILPFGVLFMCIFGQAAIRLAPTWMLPVNMFSNLNPDADFAGMENPAYIEPLNSGILTPPAWDKLFLTPNALPPFRPATKEPTPIPARTLRPPPVIITPDDNPPSTATAVGGIVLPTNVPPQFADLAITKTDNSNTYTPGTAINYTIVVINNGPDSAPSFYVEDTIPAAITGISVNCTPAASCGVNRSTGNSINFTDASLIQGGSDRLTITVSGTVSSGATGNLTNTAEVMRSSRPHYIDTNSSNDLITDTDTQLSIYDVAITKSDAITTYIATDTQFNYTVEVTNSGPSDAIGITITDPLPAGIASWDWVCTSVNSASGCNGVTGNTSDFTDTVTIQSGGNIIYSVTANLAAITPPQNPWLITNTANIIIPSGPGVIVDPNLANNSSADINTPLIDLQITKDDLVPTYAAGSFVTYTITVTNNSSFDLYGIGISDPKPAQITTWSWSCLSGCTPVTNSSSDFTDTIDLLANTTLVYTVTANIIGTTGDSLVEDLSNTATVNLPTGLVDADTSNNLATDTDTPSNPGPNLGSWDTIPYDLVDGGSVTIALSTPLTGDGGASPDLVYYEWLNGTQVMLDWVLIEISADHTNWDTVFFWGNGAADTNTNVDISNPAIGGAEDDNRNFDPADLYNTSGVTIDIDALGLSGSYPYIRITAPQIGGTYGDNDGVGVDSIQLWYP